jgi:hypothetical protein
MIEVRRVGSEVKREHSLQMVTSLGTLFFSAESEYAISLAEMRSSF